MRKYEDVKDLMYGIAVNIRLKSETPSDLVHDAWINGSLHRCKDYQLRRTIVNSMLRARRDREGAKGYYKSEGRLKTNSWDNIDWSIEKFPSVTDKGQDIIENKEITEKLLKLLNLNLRKVVELRITTDWSYAKIGEHLGITSQMVVDRYRNAIKQLRESKLIKELA